MHSRTPIDRAVAILRAGGLVAFPTETVYGLGADAANERAVRKIFEVKDRPPDHPVIVHLAHAQDLTRWAQEISPAAERLMQRFWPGPLTLIFKRAAKVLDAVTGGQQTVGLRVPSHPIAQELLRRFGGGIAAPSANRFGRISPTTSSHVKAELGDRVDMILEGGACEVGIESTIVDVSTPTPRLLRPGGIARNELESLLHTEMSEAILGSPRVSGALTAHYAPAAKLMLAESQDLEAIVHSHQTRRNVAVIARHSAPGGIHVRWLVASADARAYAHDLYSTLRELDERGFDLIIVEAPPAFGAQWEAVRDRLQRAAAGSGAASNERADDDAP